MSKDLIWSYFLQLSNHMWDDETTTRSTWYTPNVYLESDMPELNVWDDIIKYVAGLKYNMVIVDVGDGVLYDSHPEISDPGAWTKDFTKKKLDEMRSLGLEPIPKLNFSTAHDTWLKEYRRKISTPEYYRLISDLISEVCELFGNPRFFHLGLDEEAADAKFSDLGIVRSNELWWHDLYFMFAECEKHGAQPWIFSDSYWYNADMFLKKMPKSVLQSNSTYDKFCEYDKSDLLYRSIKAYDDFDKHGFEQVPLFTTWAVNYNAHQTLGYCKDHISPELLKGYITIPWTQTRESERYRLMNDAYRCYLARKHFYPETL